MSYEDAAHWRAAEQRAEWRRDDRHGNQTYAPLTGSEWATINDADPEAVS